MKLILINSGFAARFGKIIGDVIEKDDLLKVWTGDEIEYNFKRMLNIFYTEQPDPKTEPKNLKKETNAVLKSTDPIRE
jgi:hypothetical protein